MAYVELFRGAPELLRLSALGLLGRVPSGMLAVALVLLVERESGSYSVGGLAAALFSGGSAVGGIGYARAIARRGYRGPLVVGGIAGGVALVLLAVAAGATPPGLYLPLTATAGLAFPPLSACIRSQWNRAYADTERRLRAATFESVVGEIAFLIGPVLVTVAMVIGSEGWAVAGAGVMTTVASAGFGRYAIDEDSPEPAALRSTATRMISVAFVATLIAGTLWCMSFGAMSVGVVAAAEDAGHRAYAGLFVAVVSVGAIVGGLAFGSRAIRVDPTAILPAVLAMYGASLAPLGVVAESIVALVALLLVLGTTSAIVLACLNVRIVDRVSPAREVEAFSWLRAFTVAGLAVGPAIGGWLIDIAGPALAFVAAGAIAGLGAVVVLPRSHGSSAARR